MSNCHLLLPIQTSLTVGCLILTNYILIQAAIEAKHRGYGFITFANQGDAMDAIDNMDMNELNGHVLKVNIAKTTKIAGQGLGNRAGVFRVMKHGIPIHLRSLGVRGLVEAVRKPLDQSGGESQPEHCHSRRCIYTEFEAKAQKRWQGRMPRKMRGKGRWKIWWKSDIPY